MSSASLRVRRKDGERRAKEKRGVAVVTPLIMRAMHDSYAIQAAWNDGNSFTAPLPARYGTLYALAAVNEVYELQSVGPATSLDEIQVRNDVGESVSISCRVNGTPIVVQP